MIENLGGGGDGIELPETREWERESKENFVDDKKKVSKVYRQYAKEHSNRKEKKKINKDTGNLESISNLGNTHGIARKHDSQRITCQPAVTFFLIGKKNIIKTN